MAQVTSEKVEAWLHDLIGEGLAANTVRKPFVAVS